MIDPQQLFGRVCKVTAWREPTTIGGLDPSFFEQLGNGTEITDARMQFNIDKHLSSEPNTCTITISNLAPDTLSALCRKPLHVRIDAGFVTTGARSLFVGDLTFGASKKVGTDWETKLQLGEGARAYAHARANKSFTAPIQVREVLTYVARTMNLQLPPEIEQSSELSQALATGISLHGPTRDVLTRLLAPYGYHWSVQKGKLQILRDDQVIANESWLVNKSTGLIGSPERSAPDKATGRSEVTFESELYAELSPGGTVKLESAEINGTFKIIQVTHNGDTRGPDFKSTVKVVPR